MNGTGKIYVAADEWAMQVPIEAFRLILSHAHNNLTRVPDQTAEEHDALKWVVALRCKKEML